MTTRRVLSARRTAADALAWLPYAAPPAAALRDLIDAIAIDFHDGDRADAVVSLLDDHDAQFADLLLLGTGINLAGAADPIRDAAAALADHVERVGTAFAIGDPEVPVALARLVNLTAAAHYAGDRRAAFRALANRCDSRLTAMFAAVVRVEL